MYIPLTLEWGLGTASLAKTPANHESEQTLGNKLYILYGFSLKLLLIEPEVCMENLDRSREYIPNAASFVHKTEVTVLPYRPT